MKLERSNKIPSENGYYGFNISPSPIEPTWEIVKVYNGTVYYYGRDYNVVLKVDNTNPEDWTHKIEIEFP